MPEQVPLTTLLSWVWIAHTIEVDNAFEAASSEPVRRHFRISLPMWTNGLRFIAEDGITVYELRRRARAVCNIGGLERWGWISVGEVGGERRAGYGSHRGVKGATVLRPTGDGVLARRLWPRMLSSVEERWRARFHTHVADGDSITEERPLVALIGQVLTALTLDHEKNAAVSVPLGANVLRVMGPDVVRTRDLPALTGLSSEGTAMAAGYLERRGLAISTPGRAVRLTLEGLNALDDYRHWAARPKDQRLRGALEAVVAQSEALSTGLVPPEGCWRGERPFLARTQRLLANPTGALPWHPMVLHRGAWPDAS